MITFLVESGGEFGIQEYLASWGQELKDRLSVRSYDDVANAGSLDAGTYIFAALDQLSPAQLAMAASVKSALAHAGLSTLNDPERTLQRYFLLSLMYERGINEFRAARASAAEYDLSFPVFIRLEREHTGSLTPLLDDQAALDAALVKLRWRGYRRDELLIVEFCDTRGSDGLYRKYSAFMVAGEIIPRAMSFSRNWAAKASTAGWNAALAEEELAYMQSNPHADRLRTVFDLACVDYGRMDYGLKDGHVQVWEINLNPTIAPRLGAPVNRQVEALRNPSKQLFFDAFARRLRTLDGHPTATRRVALPHDRSLRRRISHDYAKHAVRSLPRRLVSLLQRSRAAQVVESLTKARDYLVRRRGTGR